VNTSISRYSRTNTNSPTKRLLAIILTAFALISGGALSAAPAANAASYVQGNMPEWYQFCYEVKPVSIVTARSYYINAFAGPSGVTCRHGIMPNRAGFPYIKDSFYSWDFVCRNAGWRGGWWDGRYPRCWR
jgi:hypothetical protein